MSLHCERSTYGLTGFIFLLTICIKGTTGWQDITPGVTTTLEPYITASALSCPVIILVPEILYADYGKKVQFQVSVEAKLEYPTNGRWQKISNGVVLKSIDTNTAKYRNTSTLPPIQLVINNADFDDVGEYRLQVRISNGWCSSSTLQLQHIYGVLGYNESCNHTRECDERKLLQCASNACFCNDLYYPYGQTCYPRNHLEANIVNSIINASSIHFEWKNSSHSDLIQEYTVSIIDGNGTTITNTSVGKQTRFNFQYEFIHGNIYYCIFSTNVKIEHTGDLFTVIKEKQMVLAPLPPGQIDKHNSSFHPEKLHLKWTVPINNTRVDSYSVIIFSEYGERFSSSWSNEVTIPSRFQPDINCTVTLYAISYGSYSPNYTEVIHTLRTPVLTTTPFGWHATPYLSKLEINCTIRNSSGFPPILETKWQRNKLDFNISDSMYKGSSLDLINPKLVINRIDFDRDDDVRYQCMARNSEGWGSNLSSDIRINVIGSKCLSLHIIQ